MKWDRLCSAIQRSTFSEKFFNRTLFSKNCLLTFLNRLGFYSKVTFHIKRQKIPVFDWFLFRQSQNCKHIVIIKSIINSLKSVYLVSSFKNQKVAPTFDNFKCLLSYRPVKYGLTRRRWQKVSFLRLNKSLLLVMMPQTGFEWVEATGKVVEVGPWHVHISQWWALVMDAKDHWTDVGDWLLGVDNGFTFKLTFLLCCLDNFIRLC